jgi:hypothetical protein
MSIMAKKKRTCILVKDGTFSNVTQLLHGNQKTEVWLKAENANGAKVTLANIYREWGQNQEDTIDQLGDMMEEQNQHSKLLVAGDFNLDPSRLTDSTYGARTTTSKLLQRAERAGLSQISFGKTFQQTVLDTVVASELDWILTSHPDMVINKDKIESAMSDHDMINWDLNLKKQTMPSNVTKGLRNYTRVNKSNFAKDLAAQPWETLAEGTTEEMANQFNKLLMEVVNKHAAKDQKLKGKQTPKPSAALKNLRRMRDNARSKGQKEKLWALRRECHMMSRQEGHTHICDRLKKGS